MKKVKNILFRVKLEGYGIVNYDSPEQKNFYYGTKINGFATRHDNINYAKKNFFKAGEDVQYKIKISSDCLRHEIFKEDFFVQIPNLIHEDGLLYSFIGSPAAMLRGYLFAETNKPTLKRKSAVTMTDAVQTCDAISIIETFAKSGEKNRDIGKSDNTFFKKETIGDIKYEAIGNLDLMALQFLSGDLAFDRLAFDTDKFEIFKKFMSMRIEDFNSEIGYYQIANSVNNIPELGIKFSNNNVVFFVKAFFNRLLKMDIRRNNAFAKVSNLEYKLVFDPLEDTFDDENGWVTLGSESAIDEIDFVTHDFYIEHDFEKAEKFRFDIKEAIKKSKKEIEEDKIAKKEERKKKNTKNKHDE